MIIGVDTAIYGGTQVREESVPDQLNTLSSKKKEYGGGGEIHRVKVSERYDHKSSKGSRWHREKKGLILASRRTQVVEVRREKALEVVK